MKHWDAGYKTGHEIVRAFQIKNLYSESNGNNIIMYRIIKNTPIPSGLIWLQGWSVPGLKDRYAPGLKGQSAPVLKGQSAPVLKDQSAPVLKGQSAPVLKG